MSNNSNLSAQTSPSYKFMREPFAVEVTRLVVEVFIALCGVFGNVLVCLVVTKRFRTNSPINVYILSLAVADLGVLMVNLPFAIMMGKVRTHWPLGEVVCRFVYPTIEVFFCASIWSITAIAIERYRNIVHMVGVGAKRSTISRKNSVSKKAASVVAAVWLGSLVTVLPISVHYKYYSELGVSKCRLVWPSVASEQIYNVAIVILWYIMPLSIITWTYIHVAQSIRQSTTFHKEMERHGSSGHSKNSRIKQNSKAKRILTPLVIVFAVTMLPINTMRIAVAFWKDKMFTFEGFFVVLNLSISLTTVNSASNALIYSLVSKEFRAGFKALLWSWKTKWRNRMSFISTDSEAVNNFRSHWKVKSRSSNEVHWPLPKEYDNILETDV